MFVQGIELAVPLKEEPLLVVLLKADHELVENHVVLPAIDLFLLVVGDVDVEALEMVRVIILLPSALIVNPVV